MCRLSMLLGGSLVAMCIIVTPSAAAGGSSDASTEVETAETGDKQASAPAESSNQSREADETAATGKQPTAAMATWSHPAPGFRLAFAMMTGLVGGLSGGIVGGLLGFPIIDMYRYPNPNYDLARSIGYPILAGLGAFGLAPLATKFAETLAGARSHLGSAYLGAAVGLGGSVWVPMLFVSEPNTAMLLAFIVPPAGTAAGAVVGYELGLRNDSSKPAKSRATTGGLRILPTVAPSGLRGASPIVGIGGRF